MTFQFHERKVKEKYLDGVLVSMIQNYTDKFINRKIQSHLIL